MPVIDHRRLTARGWQAPPATGAVTIDELRQWRKIAAGLVKQHGERFLPVFRYMDRLVQEREAAAGDVARALQFAD